MGINGMYIQYTDLFDKYSVCPLVMKPFSVDMIRVIDSWLYGHKTFEYEFHTHTSKSSNQNTVFI